MPNQPQNFLQVLLFALAAVGAGALDYLYRVHSNRQEWSLIAFVLHLCLALFSGSIAVMMVTGLGYGQLVAGAAAGAAGFLNVRVFELIEVKLSAVKDK